MVSVTFLHYCTAENQTKCLIASNLIDMRGTKHSQRLHIEAKSATAWVAVPLAEVVNNFEVWMVELRIEWC